MQTEEPPLGSDKATHRNRPFARGCDLRSYLIPRTGPGGRGPCGGGKLQFAQGIGFGVFTGVSPSFYSKPLYGAQSVSVYLSIIYDN